MNNLKKLREEHKLSLKALEIKTGIKANSYSRYENEKREIPISVLKLLATFYNVSIDFLLGYNNCLIYVTYEREHLFYTVDLTLYHLLLENNYIYFNKDKRCIDLNKVLNVKGDASVIIDEYFKINRIISLMENNKIDINILKEEYYVNLNVDLLKKIKNIILSYSQFGNTF